MFKLTKLKATFWLILIKIFKDTKSNVKPSVTYYAVETLYHKPPRSQLTQTPSLTRCTYLTATISSPQSALTHQSPVSTH